MLGHALAEENIPIWFWLFNISSALIDPVVFCISQTRAIAPLTQQVVDHMFDRMGYYSQEILPTDRTIVDRFKSWVFSPLERDCVQVTALRVACLLSYSCVQMQLTRFTERFVLTVTPWILRAKFADSNMGITPINLEIKICYKEEQLRCKSLFGHYLRWRFWKQNLVCNSSDNRQVRVETRLLSAACIPSTALADMESNSKNIVRKFSRSCSEGESRDGRWGRGLWITCE